MKSVKKLQIRIDENSLLLCKNKGRQVDRLLIELSILIIWYSLIMIQDVNLAKIENYFVYLFYLAPLVRIPAWIRMIKIAIYGERMIFSKKSKEFTIEGKFEKALDAIKRIELNYELREDVNLCFLDLRFRDGKKYRIEQSDAYWNRELVEAGNKISGFLGMELVNNHPYGKKMVEPVTIR